MPCRIDNESRLTPGVCLMLTNGLPRSRFDQGEIVMCQKKGCKEYIPRANEIPLVTPENLRVLYLEWWWAEYGGKK